MNYNGIEITVDKPALAGAYDDSNIGLIILGGSKMVWDDYFEARAMFDHGQDYNIMAINDIAAIFKAEHLDHIVSLHGEMISALRTLRKVRIGGHSHTHSNVAHEDVDLVWGQLTTSGGTSALFAVKIAMAMGYKKIILCGCGLDKTGHFYDPEIPEDNKNGWFDEACRMPWKDFYKSNEEARTRVRFMSGELKSVYGTPSHDWVYNTVGV